MLQLQEKIQPVMNKTLSKYTDGKTDYASSWCHVAGWHSTLNLTSSWIELFSFVHDLKSISIADRRCVPEQSGSTAGQSTVDAVGITSAVRDTPTIQSVTLNPEQLNIEHLNT